MESAYPERSRLKGSVAKVINASGSAAAWAYDMTSAGVGKALSVAKRTPVLPEKVMDIFASGFDMVRRGEKKQLEDRIKEYERKIKSLYFQIGKKGASYSGDKRALETASVKKLIADVREHEKEIQRMRDRIAQIKKEKKARAFGLKKLRKTKKLAKKSDRASDEKLKKRVESAIAKAVKHGEFQTRSEREIFDKVANDLLDSEMEIKVLAAAELGKIGNNAAMPILIEVSNFGHPDLTSEVINSLIMLGDSRAVRVFKKNADHSNYRVRIGCIRGLYKLAEDQEALPVLTKGLKDEHPEVRRTAATFIGWKDYADAAPSLVQCLRDEDARVRKAAVSALANIKDSLAVLPLIKVLGDKDLEIREKSLDAIKVITGEEIAFDLHGSGKELTEAINNLRDWWQQERLGKKKLADAVVTAEAAEETAKSERVAEEEAEFTYESLMRMTKSELLSLCEERGIKCREKQTKSEISQLILGEQK